MIAHSTALESITMEVGDHNLPRPSIVGGIRLGQPDLSWREGERESGLIESPRKRGNKCKKINFNPGKETLSM